MIAALTLVNGLKSSIFTVYPNPISSSQYIHVCTRTVPLDLHCAVKINTFTFRITSMFAGDRRFSPWKGSVVDSVVGVFLTQNVSDHLSR